MKFRTGVSSSHEDASQELVATEATHAGLVLLYAPNFEQLQPAYPFYTESALIGRDVECSVCVPEQAVSRQHAKIVKRGDHPVLIDLGSRNGTILNGSNVAEEVLEHGAEIRVGDTIFKYVNDGCERYRPYRIDGSVKGGRRATKLSELVGGAVIDALAADIERIAPTELSCVVLGETGTGKEVVARGIHGISGRKGSLQAINCAAIPQNLLESELFGYRRGAFSGADRDKPGLVKLADGGTLFLDEIGDMPMEAQAKLLRVLQSKEVFPLGATNAEHVDIRVVCATHRDLHDAVRKEKFRGDLFARLNEHSVRLPPLRDRKEDIYQLAKSFAVRYGRPDLELRFPFLLALFHYDWPFNVRELESAIKRGVALSDGAPLDARHLPDALAELMKSYAPKREPKRESAAEQAPPPEPAVLEEARGRPSADALRALLATHKGNVAAVGRELGKERMQVHRWLKMYGIDLADYRS